MMYHARYIFNRVGLVVAGSLFLVLLVFRFQRNARSLINDSVSMGQFDGTEMDVLDRALESPHVITPTSVKKKKILAWTKMFNKDFLVYHNGRVVPNRDAFKTCPIQNCEWTIDRNQLNSSDAVLFHIFIRDFRLNDLPQYRRAEQQWVFMNLEPPIRFRDGMMGNLDSMFNLTATYEDDADISIPYGFYYKRETPISEENYLPDLSTKTKSIVWMVSRCKTISRREVYAEDLKKFIDVDIIGACGRPAPKKGSPPINLDFRKELALEYYFYLAFENSNCKDYITEKFWTALLAGLVPIVRGQFPRYEKHAPPGSYINADAFFSYEDLAQYLKFLMEHPEEYKKYFKWKQWYTVATIGTFQNLDVHCRLCAYLNSNQSLVQRPAYKMSERYSSTERCFSYHHNLPNINFELEKAYDDEFKGFLPL